jgi:putative ABC transport system permease protein
MISDLRLALRSLLKTPGFTAVSVIILALGIGAVTAVFSAVEAVLIHPLPYAHPEQLYGLESAAFEQVGLFSIPEFCAYRDQNRTFTGVAAAGNFSTNLVDHGDAVFVRALRISGNAFDLLGAQPTLGRLLTPEDDRPGAPRVVVLSAGLWRRAFGGRADVIGRLVSISGQSCEVVGVLPAGFILPVTGYTSDVCIPLQPDTDPGRYIQGSLHFMRVFGRTKPGVTQAMALDDMASILQDLRRQYPADYNGSGVNHLPLLQDEIVGDSRPMLLTLFGLVGALLLLASTNLAGLHLVRAISRSHDFALRTALGASRTRLMRIVIAECLLLAVAGGLAGVLFANWGLQSLHSFMPADLPRAQDLSLNGTILAFSAAVSLGFGLLPALAPIWLVSRVDLRSAMAAGGRRMAGGQRRVRQVLASIQVAVALALLVSTALFLRSFWAAGAQHLGFNATNTLTARLSLPEVGYKDPAALARHYERLQARLSALPGVDKVGVTSLLPLVPGLATTQFMVTGHPVVPVSQAPSANYRLVSSDYFSALQIPLREGRVFTERDDPQHPLVMIIGAALADSVFPNHNAVGQRIDVQDAMVGFRTAVIIGVAENVKQTKIEDAPSFDIYMSYRQMDPVAVSWLRYRSYWVIRGSQSAASMEAAFRKAVHAEDSTIAISAVQTMAQVGDAALATRRFTLLLVGFFAGTALLLTVAGIYSVIAFGVAQRTREIGVRMALGAQAEQVFTLIVREGILIVAWGAPVGIIVALLLSNLIAAQLYGVGPRDPLALLSAFGLVTAIAFVASWLPALRASKVDPMVALRAE